MGSIITAGAEPKDPSGAETVPMGRSQVAELQEILVASGLGEVVLADRYSVVFVYPGLGVGDRYPELAGCTTEVCTFADEVTAFRKHGIQLVGLSTSASEPPGDFLGSFPFPIGRIREDASTSLIEFVDKDGNAFATRRSFVIFPDGTGVRIADIKDPRGHVAKCFQIAIGRRLAEYQEAAISAFRDDGRLLRSSMTHTGFLANGVDSISISTVDLRAKLVAKMASPDIISQEGSYMARINRLLQERGKASVFPEIVAIRSDQRPAYYLMEAANPESLDHVVFADAAMTELRSDRLHLITKALDKLANLHGATLRDEEPAVARYHYLGRFEAIQRRQDFEETFEFVFGGTATLETVLSTPLVIDDGFVAQSLVDQVARLRSTVDLLVQPTGAYLHGDVHLKNMLVSEGDDIIYVDPRVVWDGNDVGDPGFGDPLYDFGTLLHSLHVMSAILRAIDSGETEALLMVDEDVVEGVPSLVVSPGLLRITDARTIGWFTSWMERTVPPTVLGEHWRARLHVNAANALFGWLKYAQALRTRHAWLAVFASVLYHLQCTARHLERTGEEGVRR
jgi:peroxiredoxin